MTESNAQVRTVRKIPFAFDSQSKRVDRNATEVLQQHLDVKRSQYVSQENVFAYRHGVSWRSHESYQPNEVTTMEAHSTELHIPFDLIVSGDLSAMAEKFHNLVDNMHGTMVRSLYKTMSEVCEEEGQVVKHEPNKSIPDQFLEMLHRVEFGVDRNGQVSRPQIHVSPAMGETMLAALAKAGPDFEARVQSISEQKEREALERERIRKAKFLRTSHLG